MTRRLFFRTLAVLVTGLLIYVWIGVTYLTGGFQPWVYEVFGS